MDFIIKISLLVIVTAATLYYFSSIRVRELAIIAAHKHCQSLGVQLLDQSVSLKKVRVTKNHNSNPAIDRTYSFEFTSTGDERYQGELNMQNNRVVAINLQAHRMPENPEAPLANRPTYTRHEN